MNSLWTHCLQHFERELPAQQFRTWIAPLSAVADGHVLTITAPNRFVLQWVKDRFLPVIQQLARETAPERMDVVLQLAQGGVNGTVQPVFASTTPRTVQIEAGKTRVREHSRLNPTFTFDSFVTGKGQPTGACSGSAGRRASWHRLQPAVHLRRRRPGQDASDPGDRQPGA